MGMPDIPVSEILSVAWSRQTQKEFERIERLAEPDQVGLTLDGLFEKGASQEEIDAYLDRMEGKERSNG